MSISDRTRRRRETEFIADYIAATGGGERDRILDDITPIGTGFDEKHWAKNGYQLIATYQYKAATGEDLYQALRFHHKLVKGLKRFAIRHKDPDTGHWMSGSKLKVAYRWPELIANPDAIVYVCEGEKDADRLGNLGLAATTVAGQNWSEVAAAALANRDVVILEDCDEAGRDNSAASEEALKHEAKSIRIIRLPGLAHKEDVSDWLDAGHSAEELIAIVEATPKPRKGFTFINYSNWDSIPVPEQKWLVQDRFPAENVSLFSGMGEAGKSYILAQLAVASALGKDWLGTTPLSGPTIFVDCEDVEAVFHRRLDAILRYNNALFRTVLGKLHIESLANQDAVLGAFNRKTSRVEPTQLYYRLREKACDIRPVAINILSLANVFAGNEIDRTQVQQFVGLMTRIAIESGAAVILGSHPSLTGISTGSGISGSTQWHNAVRARAVLKGVGANGEQMNGTTPRTDFRVIEFFKNNYGAMTESITVKFENGLFVPVTVTEADRAAHEAMAEDTFLRVMQLLLSQNQDLSPAPSSTRCAVKKIIAHPEASSFSKPEMEATQQRLLDANRIHITVEGSNSRAKERLKFGPGPLIEVEF